MYEKIFRTLKEAKEAQKIAGGKISNFLSTDENGEVITVYALKYSRLF